jgi:predicted ATPase
MIPPLHLRLSTAEKTQLAGLSLAETLYKYPTTIFLTGEVGAGKTTFMQGFAEALGITEPPVPRMHWNSGMKHAKALPFFISISIA